MSDKDKELNDEKLETDEVESEELSVEELLMSENEKLKQQLEDEKNKFYKAYADTENMKKRLQAESETNRKYRVQSFAHDILPVLDSFERALTQEFEDEKLNSYVKGYEMIYQQLLNALNKEGVTVIEALNKPFDPNFHQTLMQEKVEGVEPGIVIEELQKGYMLKDRVLRATLVKVSE